MRAAVTGANGFVGSHLTRFLSSKNIEIVGIVRKGKESIVGLCGGKPIAVDYFDLDSLKDAVSDTDVVFHFTGKVHDRPGDYEKDYVELGKNVVKACEAAGVRKIVFNSGLGVANYGKDKRVTDEYFLSRLKMEGIMKKSKLLYTIFRPSTIIGGGNEFMPSDAFTASIVEDLTKEREVAIAGDGNNIIQPIWIDDVCDVYYKCIGGHDNEVFDLVGPEEIRYLDYVKMIANIVGKKLNARFIDVEEASKLFTKAGADMLMLDERGDHSTIEKEFGVKLRKPSVVLKQIVQSVIC